MSEAIEGAVAPVAEAPVSAPVEQTVTPETAQTEAPAEPQAFNFAESLGEDYAHIAEKYESPADLAKAYSELNKQFSQREVPETPTDYNLPEIEGWEWNDDTLDKFGGKMKDLGYTQEAATGALQMYAQAQIEQAKADSQQLEQRLDDLKNDWGDAYENNIASAQRIIDQVGGDELNKLLFNNPMLGNNATLIQAFAKMADLTSESTLPDNPAPSGGMSKAQALSEISELMDKRKATYNHEERVALQAEINKRHAIIDGK